VTKRSWTGEVRNVSLLVASAANSESFREILGIRERTNEDKSGWSAYLPARWARQLRRQTFETAIIERYRRRESSVEEALIEMYLAGISVRRVEDITEALWGTRVSPSTVSNLNQKIYAKIEAWRNRQIEGEHPYLYLDGIVMKRSWAGEVRNVSLLVASAVNSEGFREILGICEGAKEDKSGWSAFLRHLGRPRPERRAAGHFRRLQGPCRERRGFPAGGALPTQHGAFLPQRL
jgi:transposase-like protein